MNLEDSKHTARNLITAHGLRAQAVAQERASEAKLSGDSSGLERWDNVAAAIADLRRTEPRD